MFEGELIVSMQNFQNSINRFIERFQDRWETESSFRATWSTIGAACIVIFLCGTVAFVSSNVGRLFASNAQPTPVVLIDGHGQVIENSSVTYPIPTYTPGTAKAPTTPRSVQPSSAATPTATIPPTPLGATATPTTTATSTGTGTPSGQGFAVIAQQQPNPWDVTKTTNAITNITTNPKQANAPLVIILNFGNGNSCNETLPTVTLDGTGSSATIPVTIPTCFKLKGQQSVNATFTVNGIASQSGITFTINGG